MEMSVPNFLAFWVIVLVIFQSALQKLECRDGIQDHLCMPLDLAYITVSDIQQGTNKRNKPCTESTSI